MRCDRAVLSGTSLSFAASMSARAKSNKPNPPATRAEVILVDVDRAKHGVVTVSTIGSNFGRCSGLHRHRGSSPPWPATTTPVRRTPAVELTPRPARSRSPWTAREARRAASRSISATYAFTTLAGSAGIVGSADGTVSAARFSGPNDVAVDGSGNVFVAEWSNNTIRRSRRRVVTTLAGARAASAVRTAR